MRAVIQRTTQAQVAVEGEVVGRLDRPGLTVLVGITHDDTVQKARWLAEKLWTLRILPDERSCSDENAPLLVISQFTLYGNAKKGRRPSWVAAAPSETAQPLFDDFVAHLRGLGATVETGVFGAMMEVSLTNSGPFTVLLET